MPWKPECLWETYTSATEARRHFCRWSIHWGLLPFGARVRVCVCVCLGDDRRLGVFVDRISWSGIIFSVYFRVSPHCTFSIKCNESDRAISRVCYHCGLFVRRIVKYYDSQTNRERTFAIYNFYMQEIHICVYTEIWFVYTNMNTFVCNKMHLIFVYESLTCRRCVLLRIKVAEKDRRISTLVNFTTHSTGDSIFWELVKQRPVLIVSLVETCLTWDPLRLEWGKSLVKLSDVGVIYYICKRDSLSTEEFTANSPNPNPRV